MPDVRDLKDQAAKYLAKGRFDKAASAYEELCRLAPEDIQLRVRLGDALVKMGERPRAIDAYRAAAEAYARDGQLPRAIAVCKLILDIDPRHLQTQAALATLYAKRSPDAGPGTKGAVASNTPTPPVSTPSASIELEVSFRPEWEGENGPALDEFACAGDEPSGLELDTASGGSSWRGAHIAWESPEDSAGSPPSEGGAALAAVVEAMSPAVEDPFAEPSHAATAAPRTISLSDLDLGEPELLGLSSPKASDSPVVTHGLVEALERATAASSTRAAEGKAGSLLADLAVARLSEDDDVDITVEPPFDASALPEIPLFSDLSRRAFIDLASQCGWRRCAPGQVIIEEGAAGASFFVVTSGRVNVVKRSGEGLLRLAQLGEGSFFGEMALLSGAPRVASVIADEETECLEISAELLASLIARHPGVGQALKKFCRHRLLANVMATSPVFRPFGAKDRRTLIGKLKARDVTAGEAVLTEGRPADGLYVVMAGEVAVSKRIDGQEAVVATLHEGELFGEISLLTKRAATATVAATRTSTLLRLPRETFDEVISTHPQILVLVSELSEARLKALDELGRTGLGAEGLLLL